MLLGSFAVRSRPLCKPHACRRRPGGSREAGGPPLGPETLRCCARKARLQPAALATPPLGNMVQQTCRCHVGATTQTCCRGERRRCSAAFGGCHHRAQRELWPPSSDRGAPICQRMLSPTERHRTALGRDRPVAISPCHYEPCGVMAGAASACTHSAARFDAGLLTCSSSSKKGFRPLEGITRHNLRNQLKNQRDHRHR